MAHIYSACIAKDFGFRQTISNVEIIRCTLHSNVCLLQSNAVHLPLCKATVRKGHIEMLISESVPTSISAADGEGRSREIGAKKFQLAVAQGAQLAFFLHKGGATLNLTTDSVVSLTHQSLMQT